MQTTVGQHLNFILMFPSYDVKTNIIVGINKHHIANQY